MIAASPVLLLAFLLALLLGSIAAFWLAAMLLRRDCARAPAFECRRCGQFLVHPQSGCSECGSDLTVTPPRARTELKRWTRVLVSACIGAVGVAVGSACMLAVLAAGALVEREPDTREAFHAPGLAALFIEENPLLVGVERVELGAPPEITVDNRFVEYEGTIETIPARLTLLLAAGATETLLISPRAGAAVRAEDRSVPPEFADGVSRGAIERWIARASPDADPTALREVATRLAAQLEWLQGAPLLDPWERPKTILLSPLNSGRGQPEPIGFTFGPRFNGPAAPPSIDASVVLVLFAGVVPGLLVASAISPVIVARERRRRQTMPGAP
jgi:hypothetical protein